ncbi:hypothetical protein EON67_11595 [archaeon]|nr:MAG: hypothetical protein EON67_11595 [archaeon]
MCRHAARAYRAVPRAVSRACSDTDVVLQLPYGVAYVQVASITTLAPARYNAKTRVSTPYGRGVVKEFRYAIFRWHACAHARAAPVVQDVHTLPRLHCHCHCHCRCSLTEEGHADYVITLVDFKLSPSEADVEAAKAATGSAALLPATGYATAYVRAEEVKFRHKRTITEALTDADFIRTLGNNAYQVCDCPDPPVRARVRAHACARLPSSPALCVRSKCRRATLSKPLKCTKSQLSASPASSRRSHPVNAVPSWTRVCARWATVHRHR